MTPTFDASTIVTNGIGAFAADAAIILFTVFSLGVAFLLVYFGWRQLKTIAEMDRWIGDEYPTGWNAQSEKAYNDDMYRRGQLADTLSEIQARDKDFRW